MRIQDVIRAEKTAISISEWGRGKIPRKKFPLSKAGRRAFSFGQAWEWRFVEFECAGRKFILRLLLCDGKGKAHIHLAMRSGTDLAVMCCYEFHADHSTGWHLHTPCGHSNDIDSMPHGTLVHGPWTKRIPIARAKHRHTSFNRDSIGGLNAWLWHESMRFFGIEEKGELV